MLSSKLSDASDIEAVLKIAAESISHLLQINVGCIYIEDSLHRSTFSSQEKNRFTEDCRM